MESLESDQQSPKGNDVEEAPNIEHHEEGDQQSLKGNDQSLKGNDVEQTPNIVHCEEGDQQNLKRNDVEETPNVAPREEGEDDGIPKIGMKFYSEDEAYNFYNEYAARIGFSIRKAKVRYNSNGVLRQRNFVCSKEGLKLDNGTCWVKKADKLETRTDCKASIRFAVTDGVWVVTHFNPNHNHALVKPEQRKFLRSYGKILEASLITSMGSPDIEHREEGEGDVTVPSIGIKVYSEHEAYNLYNDYATRIGFSIRKSKCHYNSKGVLRKRYYVCSKEGLKEDNETYGVKKGQRLTTRTNCKASIRFTVTDGMWEVTHFNPDHNHELVEPEQRKFLRSKRSISKANAVSSGIRPTKTYSGLTEDIGEADNVGFTLPDCHNLLCLETLNTIEAGDAQSLINYFKHKQLEDTMFFYMVQVANNNRMANFFWRDGRLRMDYDCFGDVVVVDTTFRTNKHNLVCALFVGVNHHGKDVLFGCAILLNETIDSFIWLFETFLESMGNRHPKTIFTNQCQAMAYAMEKVFPKTCHRLCLWHIQENAKQHLSSLYANSEFKMLFNKCLNGCCTEMEFQFTWDELIETFNLADNKWLKELYDLRERWCPTFSLDTFSANMRSTERSESTYNVFHYMSCKTMNLTQFLHQYEEIAERMRLAEFEEDFCCNQGLPTRASRSSGMLMQAADVYTIEIFKLFQEEMVESLSIVMKELSSAGTLNIYELTEEGHKVGHIVRYNSDSCTAACSCKMFESMGILCRHALRVLNMRSVTKIPPQYVLKRWTKSARKGIVAPDEGEPSCNNAKSSRSLLRRRLMHKAFCAVEKSLMTTRGFEFADTLLDQIIEQAESQATTFNVMGDIDKGNSESVHNDSIVDTNEEHCSLDESPVLDPPRVRRKGATNARLKNQLEKKRKTKASESNIPPVQEKQRTIVGPSATLFPPPQIPTLFHLSFYPSRVGMDANSYMLPSLRQGHFPTWAFGNPNSQPISMLQGTDQMPHASQDSSTSFNANHTLGQMPHLAQGNGSS